MTPENLHTVAEKKRLDVLADALRCVALGCSDAPIVFGSVGLHLLGGLYRLPNDIDFIVTGEECVRHLAGRYSLSDGRAVHLRSLGAIPFNPGKRVIPGIAFIATLLNERGEIIDKVLLDFQLHAPKWSLAFDDAAGCGLPGGARIAPVEAILADKCHALFRRRRAGRTNTRWMDLADLHSAITSSRLSVRADTLTTWFDFTQRILPVQEWVGQAEGPPREWLGPWRRLQAMNETRNLPPLEECWWSVRGFFDSRTDRSVWSARSWKWIPNARK